MTIESHELAHEFPAYKEKIHALKISDPHFAGLLAEYDTVDREIRRIEQEVETPSDHYTEGLKKKRISLKDELYALLQK